MVDITGKREGVGPRITARRLVLVQRAVTVGEEYIVRFPFEMAGDDRESRGFHYDCDMQRARVCGFSGGGIDIEMLTGPAAGQVYHDVSGKYLLLDPPDLATVAPEAKAAGAR